jgi:hypothetical protein
LSDENDSTGLTASEGRNHRFFLRSYDNRRDICPGLRCWEPHRIWRRGSYGKHHCEERSLFQLGFTVYLIEMVCNVVITSFFFELLEPVNRGVSLAAAFLSLVGCAIKTFSRMFYITPLFLLDRANYLNTFTPEQLQSPALLFLRVND